MAISGDKAIEDMITRIMALTGGKTTTEDMIKLIVPLSGDKAAEDTIKRIMAELAAKAKVDHAKASGKPEATVSHVGVKAVTLEFVTYNAIFSVTNPYDTPLPIFHITYALKGADRELVTGTSPDPAEPLKATATTELEIEMKVEFNKLLNLANLIGADWDIEYDLEINFVANVATTIPITKKAQMKLPTFKDLPDFNKLVSLSG